MIKMISFVAVLTLAGLHVFAQAKEPSTPVKKGNEWQMPKDVLERSKKYSEGLRQSLGLDSLTTRKVFDLYLGNTKTVDEIRVGAGSEKQKKDALAVNQLEFDEKVKAVLSPGQSAAYEKGRKAGRFRF